jgi:hypothetical protein
LGDVEKGVGAVFRVGCCLYGVEYIRSTLIRQRWLLRRVVPGTDLA